MKQLIQVLIVFFGFLAALYLGAYVMAFGGVIAIIESIKATPIQASLLAIGLLKFMLASFVGWGTFWLSMFIAGMLD